MAAITETHNQVMTKGVTLLQNRITLQRKHKQMTSAVVYFDNHICNIIALICDSFICSSQRSFWLFLSSSEDLHRSDNVCWVSSRCMYTMVHRELICLLLVKMVQPSWDRTGCRLN